MSFNEITESKVLHEALEIADKAGFPRSKCCILDANLAIITHSITKSVMLEIFATENSIIINPALSFKKRLQRSSVPPQDFESALLNYVEMEIEAKTKYEAMLERVAAKKADLRAKWSKHLDAEDIHEFKDRLYDRKASETVAIDISHNGIDTFTVTSDIVDLNVLSGVEVTPAQLKAIFNIIDNPNI